MWEQPTWTLCRDGPFPTYIVHQDQLWLSLVLGVEYSTWLLNGYIMDDGWVQTERHRACGVEVQVLEFGFNLHAMLRG